ncbi:acyl-CoA dehydrogenase [Virgibacillus sediminis]|uniref:Acyl-CoA dehydrogenase n=1 Tax=Virgibacillus sediminis TaxID=202260 RepID=A0ABV7A7Z0_9BACI
MSITQASNAISREEWIKRARMIGETAEAESQEAEQNGHFSDKVAKAIEEAEIHKLMRSPRYGGYSKDLDLNTYVDIVRTVGFYSIPAAWLTYFYSIHDIWAHYLPPEGRDEVLGTGGLLADVLAPVGRGEKDGEDGFRITGKWNFCSGVLWSEWAGLGALVELEEGQGEEVCLVAAHESEFDIIKNWDTLGLRPTGSNGVSLDNVYIPRSRILPTKYLMKLGEPMGGDYDESDPILRMPFIPFFLLGFMPVALGGIDRMMSVFHEKTSNRVRVFKEGSNEKESPSSQRLYSIWKTELSSLEGLTDIYVKKLEAYKREGKTAISDKEREEFFALRGQVSRKSANLIVEIMLNLGGTSIYKGDAVERFTRDILAFAAHPNHSYEDSMAAFGRTNFGFPGDPVW